VKKKIRLTACGDESDQQFCNGALVPPWLHVISMFGSSRTVNGRTVSLMTRLVRRGVAAKPEPRKTPEIKPDNTKQSDSSDDGQNSQEDYQNPKTGEILGPKGPEPTRYGDWERKGRVSDF